MERRTFMAMLTGGIVAAPLAAEAQQPPKVPRIGVLGDTSPPVETSYSGIAAFRQGLRDLGYEEGRHVTIEYRWAEGQRDRLPDLAADLVRSRVDGSSDQFQSLHPPTPATSTGFAAYHKCTFWGLN